MHVPEDVKEEARNNPQVAELVRRIEAGEVTFDGCVEELSALGPEAVEWLRTIKCDAEMVKELRVRFTYHPPKAGQAEIYSDVRDLAHEVAARLVELCPESRELEQALARLEEVVFWANAAIARRA